MKISVTGGTGFIGRHVVELLLEAGHEVSCLVLPGENTERRSDRRLRFHSGSILEQDTLGPFLEGSDAVLHLAGLTSARDERAFMAVNVEGTRNLLEAALKVATRPHVVLMSSLAAVGPCTGCEAHDESSPLRPITAYGRSKAALEDLVRGYGDRIAWTIIRAPSVYGPGDRSFLHFFRLVSRGLRVVLRQRSVVSLVYVRTLACAIIACIRDSRAYGNVFFIADEGTCDWDQLQTMIEEALGARTIRICLPLWAVDVLAGLSEIGRRFLRRAPLLSRDKVLEMKQPRWVVSTSKAERVLGFRPLVSTCRALAETRDWYRRAEWL